MSKSLVALESIKQTIRLKNNGYINLFDTLDFLTIEKELKAIDIIRKYCYISRKDIIPKEEYKLLTEVLNDYE